MAVHVYGNTEVVTDPEAVERHLVALASYFDPELASTRPESLESGFLRGKFGGLVAFRLAATRIEAKAKLNQNKVVEDRRAVVEHLDESLVDAEMAAAMRRLSFD